IRLQVRACCCDRVQPDGEAKQAFVPLLDSFGFCLLVKTLDYPPPAPMASVNAVHDRWPRWIPRSSPKQVYGLGSRCDRRVLWIVGSTDRHLIQLCHPGVNARFSWLPVGVGRLPRASSCPPLAFQLIEVDQLEPWPASPMPV